MKKSLAPAPPLAPFLRAVPLFSKRPASGTALDTHAHTTLLSEKQREALARIGTRLRLPARMMIYREDSPANSIFAIVEGVVKSYRELPSGRRRIATFLFQRDLFGLAEEGRYVNSAQAVTRVTIYRLPVDDLIVLMKHDADLQFQFLVKIAHELREAQRRSIVTSRRDAPGRLAMFLAIMRTLNPVPGRHDLVPLPMSRTDVADFLGLSLETVSRATGELERRGFVKFENRHLARILDETRFGRLVGAI